MGTNLQTVATPKICVVIHFLVLPWGSTYHPYFPWTLQVSLDLLSQKAQGAEQPPLQIRIVAEPLVTPASFKIGRFMSEGHIQRRYCRLSSQRHTFVVIGEDAVARLTWRNAHVKL